MHGKSGRQKKEPVLRISGAAEHNLKDVSLTIPHYRLTAVTGVSGSGKSSLILDTVAGEGRRLYLESIPSFARQFAGKAARPAVREITGLFPVIAVSQQTAGSSSRSTAGTLSEIYDSLRLLYARFGAGEQTPLTRSLFSFNNPAGACPRCRGLGLEDRIAVQKLIADPLLSLRQGALAPTLPGGYIMYSQVTVDVLDQVCRAHGFTVDIPWKELTEAQQNVIFNGSRKIKVLYGKHSLDSRLKWTGLKAGPRESGYYRGLLPVMEEILKRDRNRNILRFATSVTCKACGGTRLNPQALSVRWQGRSIASLADMELNELSAFLRQQSAGNGAEASLLGRITGQLDLLCGLGLAHLQLSRPAATLTRGDLQRIRLVNQLSARLSNVLYVFDEPTVGMHPRDTQKMLEILRQLVNNGNTVIIVEHDPDTIRQADWIIEMGPGAGEQGGEVLYNGPAASFVRADSRPAGASEQKRPPQGTQHDPCSREGGFLTVNNCRVHNLRGFDVSFRTEALNVVTGVPGAGKASLVYGCLAPLLKRAVKVDQAPIGRTPRSNPATYTGLADRIRDCFAARPAAAALGFKKGRFSFNNRGGRCETCRGAGSIQIGMHYIGDVDVICPDCGGKRFNPDTLQVTFKGKSIADVYDLTIDQAAQVFAGERAILKYLRVLQSLDLGYLCLGQPSTTLSGGEAQRIKLAASLVKKKTSGTWYILDEPTTGLHTRDTLCLLGALRQLIAAGNTVVCIEYQKQFIQAADRIIDLGPGSGKEGGGLLFQGCPNDFEQCSDSLTARFLHHAPSPVPLRLKKTDSIRITNAVTNNLQGVDAVFPKNRITVLTGVSGSGKSSLAFDTLFAEAASRFSESLSVYARSFIRQANTARADYFESLTPAVAVNRKNLPLSPRSTVGTLTGLHEKYRYLFSRAAGLAGRDMTASSFSFNREAGACRVCSGLGSRLTADPRLLAPERQLSVMEGAFTRSPAIRYYGDPGSRFTALLKEAASQAGVDINAPLQDLGEKALDLIFYGTGERTYKTVWHYRTKAGGGSKAVSGPWPGFCSLVTDEYHRRLHNKNLEPLRSLMRREQCPACAGARLNPDALSVTIGGLSIHDLCSLSIDQTPAWFEKQRADGTLGAVISTIYTQAAPVLTCLRDLRLGHLSLSRGSGTLSGGEGQRLRLAGQLYGGLTGITCILDEPTIGLHPRDVQNLLRLIGGFRDKGNTVIIVEHDEAVIRFADHIIEMGPGAGQRGGRIVTAGSLPEFLRSKEAVTPPYLKSGTGPRPQKRQVCARAFGLRGVTKHNLVNRDFDFSAGGLIAVTGVSGAGKSTLVHQVLAPTLRQRRPEACREFYCRPDFAEIISVDQRAVSGSRTVSLADFSGLLAQLQAVFAAGSEARAAGLSKRHFSYLTAQGRCPVCQGRGEITISMDFMDDIHNPCEECGGGRYNRQTAALRVAGCSLPELLAAPLTSTEAFLAGLRRHGPTVRALEIIAGLKRVGLGHLSGARTTVSLSGGEGQRLKLVRRLLDLHGRRALFLLDEPTSGLHYQDIDLLIPVFNTLADEGHTVLFIEHNRYLIGAANEVVEL